MTKQIIAAVDCDEIAYMIAAACEERTIKATNTTNKQESSFKHRTEMKKFLAGLEVPEGFYEVVDVQTPDELANALHTVKVNLKSIKDACKADVVELYISGKNNFRDKIPLPSKYKGKREDTLRPVLLDDVRNYLIEQYGAIVINDEEVDDVICHRMWDGFKSNQKIIGVTRDKDACSNMGWLFNPDKMSEPEYTIGLGSLWLDSKGKVRGIGRKFGYLQWIIGDPTDCYNPSEIAKVRFGEKSGYKILESLETDEECIQAVYDLYKTWYPSEVVYKDWAGNEIKTDVVGIMQMYLDCYRMRRWVGDTISVQDMLNSLEIKL